MGRLSELRRIKWLHPLFVVRDWLMKNSGLFALKKRIKYHIFLKRLVREDNNLKKQIEEIIMRLPDGLLTNNPEESEFVLSLTSYGERMTTSLPYALCSLINQSEPPKTIAVFLDQDHWNDDSLPVLLKKLRSVGVGFYYCEDIKSYKKLIPALKRFPNNPIITFDDDFYYNKNYLAWMKEAFSKSDKKTVLGQWGCIPEKSDGKYIPYNLWKDCNKGDDTSPSSFIGCAGILYPPHIFDEEILNKDVFMKLCPKADDIWFWAMEERQNIKRKYISPKGYGYHRPVDRIFDYEIGADGCLTLSNGINGDNDWQLRNVLDYYGLEKE